MAKSIILRKHGGPEVLELEDIKVGSPGPDEIKVTNSETNVLSQDQSDIFREETRKLKVF